MTSSFYKALEKSISSSRLSTYKQEGYNEIEIFTDYILNTKISQNFYFLLQSLEVTLRNAIYSSYKKHYPSQDFFYLYETNSFNRYKSKKEIYSRECWKMLCGVKYKLRHLPTLTDGKIIAELNFGFWTELLTSKDKKYIDMWRTIFEDVFPNYDIQRSIDHDKNLIASKIDDIRGFRNRIFHYEPIYNQNNLEYKHAEIFEILGWLNSDMKLLNELFDEFKHIQKDKESIYKKLNRISESF
jgi:hypothetical protein